MTDCTLLVPLVTVANICQIMTDKFIVFLLKTALILVTAESGK